MKENEKIFKNATDNLERKKYEVVLNQTKNKKSEVLDFFAGFFTSQAVTFLLGSLAWFCSIEDNYDNGPQIRTNGIYGEISYVQAIKNAYIFDDWRHGKGGIFQGIAGLIAYFVAVYIGLQSAKRLEKQRASDILNGIDTLKMGTGLGVKGLFKELGPNIYKILSSLSEIDRGYFGRLVSGKLEDVDYETCVSIIDGYLKSHPEEYEEIIKVIDEAVLPESIKKKYGKGKTISFGAARKIAEIKR